MSPLLSKKRSHHESSEPPEPMRELTSPQFTIVNAIPDKNHHKEQKHPKHHRYLLRRKILMFRTPDADADVDDSDDDDDFRGKQRQFEFQWQLRLKKLVPGDVYVGMEVNEPIQMGLTQRALANLALKFTKKTNQVRCAGGNEFLLPNLATRQHPPHSLSTVFLQGFSYRVSDSSDKGPS